MNECVKSIIIPCFTESSVESPDTMLEGDSILSSNDKQCLLTTLP